MLQKLMSLARLIKPLIKIVADKYTRPEMVHRFTRPFKVTVRGLPTANNLRLRTTQ